MNINFFQRFLFLLLLLVFSFSSTAFSQTVTNNPSSPWDSNVRGFIKGYIGLSYLAYADVTFEQEDFVALSPQNAGFPGFCAGLAAIPLFKDNHGLNINVAYSTSNIKFETDIEENIGYTILDLSNIDFNVGYTKFFLDGPWYLYTSIYTGFDLILLHARTHLHGRNEDDKSTNTKGYSYGLGANFGFMRLISSGGVGMELRVDSTALEDSFKIKHPFGSTTMNVWHPVQIKLALSFMLGRM